MQQRPRTHAIDIGEVQQISKQVSIVKILYLILVAKDGQIRSRGT